MKVTNENQFRFAIPIDIEKSGKTNERGEETYVFKGLASTPDRDSQGETLDARRYDLSDFKQVNWNHLGKSDSNAILGEISEHTFTRQGLMVKGEIWGEMPMSKSTINLMKRKAKKGEKLQLSVEGTVLQRGSEDKKNPAYYNILKAKLTGVAITPNPINKSTFAELITKGHTVNDWRYSLEDELIIKAIDESKDIPLSEDDLEKAMMAGTTTGTETTNKETTAEALKQEDVEGVDEEDKLRNKKCLSKSQVYESIFNYFYPIDFKKATQIYSLIEKISTMEKKTITKETINKALDILEVAEKQESAVDNDSSKTLDSAKALVKGMKDFEKAKVVEILGEAGYENDMIEKAFTEVNGKEIQHTEEKTDDGAILKAISELTNITRESQDNVDLKFAAIGAILKSNIEVIQELKLENEALKKSNDDLLEKVNGIDESTKKFSSSPAALIRKSLGSAAIDRHPKQEDGYTTYNVANKQQKAALSKRLEELSGFNQKHLRNDQFDQNLMKAAQEIEMLGACSDPSIVPYLAETHKIKVVREG